jgi:hypothetical protein
MPGNAANLRVWETGDIYIWDSETDWNAATAIPVDVATALPVGWAAAGLMHGDPGVEMPRTVDKTEINAWQQKRVKTKYKNAKIDWHFALMEDNAVTQALIDPANVPKAHKRHLCAEFVGDDGFKERWFTNAAADCWVTDSNHKEDPGAWPVEVSIYPDAAGVLFTIQSSAGTGATTNGGGDPAAKRRQPVSA